LGFSATILLMLCLGSHQPQSQAMSPKTLNPAIAGVLIRGGPALEGLGRAKAVLLDKTGTLTAGRCQVI